MSHQIADFDWYSKKSLELKSEPRCPLASCELCPRYYYSFRLLGRNDITTEIPAADETRLDKKWKQVEPVVAEEEPEITYSDGELSSIAKLCPEVGYEIFHRFSDTFCEYNDELARENTHKKLVKSGASDTDPQWRWASIRPRHYTECREYSIFKEFTQKKPKPQSNKRQSISPKLRWRVLSRDIFTCVYCGNKPPAVVLEVDHKISVNEGGTDDVENLVTGCFDCNRGKGGESVLK